MRVPRILQRTKKLNELGWCCAFVWVSKATPLREAAADQLVTLYEVAQRNPTAPRQNWVIRGSGELSPVPPYRQANHVA
jgi:hypothetical protein